MPFLSSWMFSSSFKLKPIKWHVQTPTKFPYWWCSKVTTWYKPAVSLLFDLLWKRGPWPWSCLAYGVHKAEACLAPLQAWSFEEPLFLGVDSNISRSGRDLMLLLSRSVVWHAWQWNPMQHDVLVAFHFKLFVIFLDTKYFNLHSRCNVQNQLCLESFPLKTFWPFGYQSFLIILNACLHSKIHKHLHFQKVEIWW